MMRPLFLLFICLTCLSFGLRGARAAGESVTDRVVALPGGGKIKAAIAETDKSRETGLMGVEAMKPGTGMLFLFDEEVFHWMWMKNMKIPLDIIWIDNRKEIIEILSEIPPCQAEPCPVYGPPAPSRYVLELPAGASKKYGLKKGMPLRF